MRSLLVSVLALAACGDDGSSNPTVDAPAGRDPDAAAIVDAPPVAEGCELATQLGMVTPARIAAQFFGGGGGGGGPSGYQLDHRLVEEAVYDVISLELFKGSGAFAAGFPTTFPATVQLAGDELDYASCGACVRAFGDVANGTWAGEYFATGGTLTLDALSKTKVTGRITSFTLVHVQKDMPRTIPLNDGCTTTIGELAFDVVPVMGP